MTNPSDGYYGNAGSRNPEEPSSAAYVRALPTLEEIDLYGKMMAEDAAANDDDPADLELEDQAELAVMNGEYPDVEAFHASRCNHRELEDRYSYGVMCGVSTDLIALLAYNWRDEEADYFAAMVAAETTEQQRGIESTHIFPAMKRLNDWINR